MIKRKILSLGLFFGIAILLSSFSSPREVEMNTSYTISLDNVPIYGNREYNVIVSYASGNAAYRLRPGTGFYIIGSSSKDVTPGEATVFRIKTYPNTFYIVGTVDALAAPSYSGWTDAKNFSF